jgi:hypothetical protein
VKNYPPSSWWEINKEYMNYMNKYPTLKRLFVSKDIQDRYWVNQCWDKLNEIGHGWD